MSNPQASKAMNAYAATAVQSALEGASPHRLIQMLLDGALDKIAVARGCLERGDPAGKGRHVSWAISIVSGLRASLDRERGGEIAANLDALYDYMERRLVEANRQNDAAILDEVAGLLRQIKEAWDAIGDQAGALAPARARVSP